VIAASVLGLTVAGCLWWAYFDVISLIAERVLRRAQGEARTRLARDAYSYWHLPMIAGIVLLALGLKKVLEYVSDSSHHTLSEALDPLPLAALYGGVALFLLGHVAFTFRVEHLVKVQRVVTAVVVLALIPLAAQIPALAALTLVAVILVALIALESVWFRDSRERIRHEEDDAITHLQHGG
jgi:low temperature requirement protein LtrA